MEQFSLFDMFDENDSKDDSLLPENSETEIAEEIEEQELINFPPQCGSLDEDIYVELSEYNTVHTTSLDIAEKFGILHKNVLRAIKTAIQNDTSGTVAGMFHETTYSDKQGKTQPMYLVTRNGFDMIGLTKISKNPEMRARYIMKFNAKEDAVRRALNKCVKEIDRLNQVIKQTAPVSRDKLIAQALIAAQEVIQEKDAVISQQQAELEAAQPKINFADSFQGSNTDMLIRTVANKISAILTQDGYKNNVGQNTFFEWLRKNGFLVANRKARDFNMPTKKSIDMEVMDSKFTTIAHQSIPGTWNSGTPVITPKGVIYFTEKIRKIYEEGGSISC